MRVYVPSRGRAAMFAKRKMTPDLLKEATFVVPPDEVKEYRAALLKKGRHFEVIGCPEHGVPKTRLWISKRVEADGEKKFVMCDDDLDFFVRKDVRAYNLRVADVGDCSAMLAWLDKALDNYAHASVSARYNNHVIPTGDIKSLVAYNERIVRVYAFRLKEYQLIDPCRLPVMEDFDNTLQLLRKGFASATTFWWCQGQPYTGLDGGCTSYRTLEVHNESARMLRELHPQFVTLRQKDDKHGPLRNRLEVIIQWQRAYDSAFESKLF